MKILRNNITSTDFVKPVICEHCGSVFTIEASDIKEESINTIACPVCRYDNKVEFDLFPTRINIVFPRDFLHHDGSEAKVKNLTDEEITTYVREALKTARFNENNMAYIATGDTQIIVYPDEDYYSVIVAKNVWETTVREMPHIKGAPILGYPIVDEN